MISIKTRTILISFVLTATSFTPAWAKVIRDPVFDLDYAKACPSIKQMKSADEAFAEAVEKAKQAEYPKPNVPKANFVDMTTTASGLIVKQNDSSPSPTYRMVDRDYILGTLLSRYSVKIEYAKLLNLSSKDSLAKTSFSELLADKVAPCKRDPKVNGNCETKKLNLSPEMRFEDAAEALKFRRALLRLFETAESGTGHNFVVLRQKWNETNKLTESDIGRTLATAVNYRPLVNPAVDDAVIRSFILTTEPEDLPFQVYCQPPLSTPKNAFNFEAPPHQLGWAPLGATDAVVQHEVERPRQTAITLNKATKLGQEYQKSKTETPYRAAKFSLIKSQSDFNKPKPDGAEAGVAIGGKAPGITVDGAVGLSYLFRDTKKDWSKQQAWTAYATLNQRPVDYVFATSETDANGDVITDKRSIALAEVAFGGRWDFKGRDGKWPVSSDIAQVSSRAGQYKPGWDISLGGEYLTDNNANRSGSRFYGTASLPRRFIDVKGYRLRETLGDRPKFDSSLVRRPDTRSFFEDMSSGWAVEWDGTGVIERLDFKDGREPLDLEDSDPNARVDANIFDTVLWGLDAEIEFSKANLFGAAVNESWLTFEASYGFRVGFDDGFFGVDDQGEPKEFTDHFLDQGSLGIKLAHPDFSDFSFGLGREFGRSFTDLSDLDVWTFKLTGKY